jgi:hypothetical protein
VHCVCPPRNKVKTNEMAFFMSLLLLSFFFSNFSLTREYNNLVLRGVVAARLRLRADENASTIGLLSDSRRPRNGVWAAAASSAPDRHRTMLAAETGLHNI